MGFRSEKTHKAGWITRDQKQPSFNRWRTKSLGIQTLENKPLGGWKIFGDTSDEWFGYGRVMIKVMHPEQFVIEISVENLANILQSCDIVNKEIREELIIAFEGAKLVLIPINSAGYVKAVEDTNRIANVKNVKPSSIQPGYEIELANGSKEMYLGKYPILTRTHSLGNSVTFSIGEEKYFFLQNGMISTRKSIKASQVMPTSVKTEAQIKVLMAKHLYVGSRELPIFDDSKLVLSNTRSTSSYSNYSIKETKRSSDITATFEYKHMIGGKSTDCVLLTFGKHSLEIM